MLYSIWLHLGIASNFDLLQTEYLTNGDLWKSNRNFCFCEDVHLSLQASTGDERSPPTVSRPKLYSRVTNINVKPAVANNSHVAVTLTKKLEKLSGEIVDIIGRVFLCDARFLRLIKWHIHVTILGK